MGSRGQKTGRSAEAKPTRKAGTAAKQTTQPGAAASRLRSALSRLPSAFRLPPSPVFLYALAGAVLLWAALPPLDLWPLAWIAPVPWVLLIRRRELPARRPYRVLWWVGFFFWLAALHWLRLPHWATSLGWLALSFYFAFYVPLFVGLGRVAVHRLRVPLILAAPVIWTGFELARAHLLTGFTMASLGHTQYRWIELIQISDLAGAYGVSFVVMLVAACLAQMTPIEGRRMAFWPLILLGVVLSAVLGYGYWRSDIPQAKPAARVGLIQGSIDITLKADPNMREVIHQHYRELSQQAIRQYGKLDLIVWPETMLRDTLVTMTPDAVVPPDWPDTPQEFRRRLQEFVRESESRVGTMAVELRTPMIVGVDTQHFAPKQVECYNSAAYVSAQGTLLGRYDKSHLVMFGEYVPFTWLFPWLQRLTPLPISLTAGTVPQAFEVGKLRFSPDICYESVLPHLIRRQVQTLADEGREPDVLVNLTNDGWFWGSSELDMHLVCGVFRAVECRKPFLIAANTGFSAWIDADGRIRAPGPGPRRAPGTLLAEVARDPRTSPYLCYGDWPAGLCLLATGIFALAGLRKLPPAQASQNS
jgi:apolipoprotein N-acyltransferase